MITSQLIQAAEKALIDLPRLYNSESEGLLALEIGPRVAHRFQETHGDEAYRGFLLGAFAERYATGLRSGVLTPEQIISALGIGDEDYAEPYPEAVLEDFQDQLDAMGVKFSVDATSTELQELILTEIDKLENEILITSLSAVQDLFSDLSRELESAYDDTLAQDAQE